MRKSTIFLLALAFVVSGCSSGKKKNASLDPFAGVGSPYYKGKGPIPIGGGKYHVGKPYQVAGRWFTPKEQPGYDKTGMSSWYGEAFNRRRTSNGEYFDMTQFTAAHATLPLPSYARVTNLSNGRSVVVRVNDRGPFVGTRIIDVSKRTAEALDYKHKGTEKVRVQYLGPAPLNDPGGRSLMAMNSDSGPDTSIQIAEAAPPLKIQRKKASYQTAAYDDAPTQAQERGQGAWSKSYFVELGTFADPDNVERIRQGMEDVGALQVAEIESSNGPLYRLRLGPIDEVNEATSALNAAVGFGLADARIVEAPLQQAALR